MLLRARSTTLRRLATEASVKPVDGRQSVAASGDGGRGGRRFLLWLTTGTVAGVTLTLAVCDRSAEMRKQLENQAPKLTPVLQALLGEHGSKSLSKLVGLSSEETKSTSSSSTPSLLPKPITTDSAPTPARVIATESRKPKVEPKSPKATVAAAVDPTIDRKTTDDIKLEDVEIARLNKSFEERLRGALTAAENSLDRALTGKAELGEAILKQSQSVKHAVDNAEQGVWDLVGEATTLMSKAHHVEQQAHADAQNYMDMLRSVLNDARANSATAANAYIENAQTTLGQFVVHLENAASKVRRAETEAKITTEYRRLIEESRRQFSDELEAVLPNAAVLPDSEELSEQQLNALVAHAHVKVDTLKRQLIDHQLREEQHIVDALDRQKSEHERIYGEKVARDVKVAQENQKASLEKTLTEARGKFEGELRNQLRRSAAAHSAHLEDVLAVHTAQLEAEAERKIQQAVSKERDEFHAVMSTSLQRLHTIEEALQSRGAQDAENRRAKELWLACQNLVESVVHGRKGGVTDEKRRQPLANQLICIKETSRDDPTVATLFQAFNEQSVKDGVYTEDDLCARFTKVRRICSRVAMVDSSNVSLWSFLVSAAQSMMIMQRASERAYSPDEHVDLCSPPDTHAIFHRAEYHLKERHDLTTAVRLMSLLDGEPARMAESWLTDARAHLEARQTAQLLLAHAAAQSLRTVY